MSYGIVEYNDEGLPMCEICGGHFARVCQHVRQAHGISPREYKIQNGLNVSHGICSEESAKKTSAIAYRHYDRIIKRNLLEKGSVTRFVAGSRGRTKDLVSQQARLTYRRIRILEMEDPIKRKEREEACRALGKSGLGSKARWGGHSNG